MFSHALSSRASRAALGLPVSATATIARVMSSTRGIVQLAGDVDGAFPARGLHLVTGDIVDVEAWQLVPRRTVLGRDDDGVAHALAVNVDEVWCVVACDQGLNERRLERAIVLAYDGGAIPVVVLTKADLLEAVDDTVARIAAVAPGVDVVVTSAAHGLGIDALRARLAVPVQIGAVDGGVEDVARTVCLLGISGAGKSALTNAVLGEVVALEGAVQADARGSHTTTGRELFVVEGGGVIADTPGLRAFGVAASVDALALAFPDVAVLAERCRFRDCTHEREPGCAVRDVVDPARLQSFLKLGREAAYARARHDESAQRERKRQHKALTKAAWHSVRDKRR